MHICFFTDRFTPQLNGIAISLETLANALESLGHKVSIYAPTMGDYVDELPRVHRVAAWRARQDPPIWIISPWRALVSPPHGDLDPDIVHVHTPGMMHFLARKRARGSHVPFVSTCHTLLPTASEMVGFFLGFRLPPRLLEFYSAWTCNMCDHIIAPSPKVYRQLKRYGVQRPISVIPNGIRVELFQNIRRGDMRSRMNLADTAKILLCVGRLTADKNVGLLIETLAHVMVREPSAYLLCVGHGPLQVQLEERARALGINRHLLFSGSIAPAAMPKIYAEADIYVSASFSEVHSIAALEALASGLPLVVVDDPAFELNVVNGVNGFRVAPRAEVFAQHILDILEHPARLAEMRQHSARFALNWTVQTQAGKLANLYSQLASRRIAEIQKAKR